MQQHEVLELTLKSILIGIILAVVLCGANVYLGLKIGQTISASIPASILAMGMLRMFKKYNVLENSISQTIASAGEAIAAVVIFVFPALLILGTWQHFNYWSICLLSISGGIVGIIFSIILRTVLLNDPILTFPEGQAIGAVLKSTNNVSGKGQVKSILLGIGISGFLAFCQNGLQFLASTYYKVIQVGKMYFGFGTGFSTALIGAGYLIGFNTALVGMIACLAGWLILLPLFSVFGHRPDVVQDATSMAFSIWKMNIRPIGIGVMIFSGFATIISLAKPIKNGLLESLRALKNLKNINEQSRDLNINKMLLLLIVTSIPIGIFIFYQLSKVTDFSMTVNIILACVFLLLVMILSFIISAVAGYFAGMVGSTNSPNSGLLFIGVMAISIALLLSLHNVVNVNKINDLYTTIILLVAFIGFGACITNDCVQDFKSGQIVGATPAKQQISLFIGVIVSALVAPIFIELIYQAYGIAGVIPHPGIDPQNTLSAPQATAIATLTKHIIGHSQDWTLIIYGVVLGIICLILDKFLHKKYASRCPMISVGIGLYLPPEIVITLFIGGLMSFFIKKKHKQLSSIYDASTMDAINNKTNLLICGLVAGESLMGLLLAVPFVMYQSSDILKIVPASFTAISEILSVIITIILLRFIYVYSTKNK